jgi:hypothetical protein
VLSFQNRPTLGVVQELVQPEVRRIFLVFPEMELMKAQFSLRFLGIALGFLRLEVSTIVYAFIQNAIHEQT